MVSLVWAMRTRKGSACRIRTDATLERVELLIGEVTRHEGWKSGPAFNECLEDGDGGAERPRVEAVQRVVDGEDPDGKFLKPRHGECWRRRKEWRSEEELL